MKRTIFLMLAVLLSALSASAYVCKVDGIAYNYNTTYLSDATYFCVVSGSDRKNAISIPSRVTYSGYTLPVIQIASDAFKDYTNLTSVTIPSSVTQIYKSAFAGCTSLTSVVLPNSITVISEALFKNCTGLPAVTIPNSVTQIYKSAFAGCTGLTSVTFNAANCSSPSSIDLAWFKDCPLTSLVIGDKVKSIPDYLACNQTKLKKVTIPNSVTSIGDYAFYCCTGLTSVTIGNSVTSIGDFAFRGCTGLTLVTIPNSVTSIGGGAFKHCI